MQERWLFKVCLTSYSNISHEDVMKKPSGVATAASELSGGGKRNKVNDSALDV